MNVTATPAMLAASMSFQERALYGLQVFVIGIVTVFCVLALLWGVMVLFRIFAYDLPNKKKEKEAAEAKSAAAEHPVPAAEDIPLAAPAQDDSQLVAVLAAAIAAYNSAAGNALPFRVVSYKRVHNAGGWNGAANNESN